MFHNAFQYVYILIFYLFSKLYLCFSASTDDDVNIKNGDLFVIELEIVYPPACDGMKVCDESFIARFYRIIVFASRQLYLRISFTNGITSNVLLVFELLNQIIISNSASTIAIGENLLLTLARETMRFFYLNKILNSSFFAYLSYFK